MQLDSTASLRSMLRSGGDLDHALITGIKASANLGDLATGSVLAGRGYELRDRSVLVLTGDQFTAAAVQTANVDAVVSDRTEFGPNIPHVRYFVPCAQRVEPQRYDRNEPLKTEWVLLTSGTLGAPKLVAHTLISLTGAIVRRRPAAGRVVWSTFYDIRRYGGLQIFLRAVLTGASLVLSSTREDTADFLARAGSHGVTHISGTPSHWRRALMSSAANRINPEYVRLSGEIADQGILDHLRSVYPKAKIAHAFASTEAGVAFSVEDELAGFPAGLMESTPNVKMKIENRTLRIRSARTANCNLGDSAPAVKDAEGFVDTGDMIELRDGRYYFVGRRDGRINVGGLKVHPEEIEAVINRHREVHMSRVRAKKNPVTGAIVVADVVLRAAAPFTGPNANAVRNDILELCRGALSSHKVPATINFVSSLAVSESGKMMRGHA